MNDSSTKTGMLFLVDLAGSEMVKKTHATGQVRTVPGLFLLLRSCERRRATLPLAPRCWAVVPCAPRWSGDVVAYGSDNSGHPGTAVIPAPYTVLEAHSSVAFRSRWKYFVRTCSSIHSASPVLFPSHASHASQIKDGTRN